MWKVYTKFFAGSIAAALFAVTVSADTIATFADPAPNGSTPLFHFVSGIPGNGALSGSWNGNGLLLQTPGLAAPDFTNAHFVMQPVAATGGPVAWTLGAGNIDFLDNSNSLLFSISFQGGNLTSPTGFGGSDFVGNGVTFSGPIIPGGLTNESFAFSFANPAGTLGDYTVTSAFTSSATVPEPASIGLLLLGCVSLLRRR